MTENNLSQIDENANPEQVLESSNQENLDNSVIQEQQHATEEVGESNQDGASTSPKKFSKKKKTILFASIGVVLVVAIIVAISIYNGRVFNRLVSQMLHEYQYADNAVAADGSYLKIDTNPYDKDVDDLTVGQAATFYQKQSDSLDGIKFVNKKLGFSDAVYSKMLETSALMGRQSEENSKYRVSWTYHPKKGLEVMYEKR